MHKFPFTTKHFISGTNGTIDLSWSFTDKPVYTMKITDRNGIQDIDCADYDPYEYELNHIIDKIIKNEKDDISSIGGNGFFHTYI